MTIRLELRDQSKETYYNVTSYLIDKDLVVKYESNGEVRIPQVSILKMKVT